MTYIINITRIVIGLIFFYSFVSKLRDFKGFKQSIKNFQMLSDNFHGFAAISFMGGESLVVIGVILGGRWLYWGYNLSLILLGVFSYALSSILRRNIQISCNCFGAGEQKVSLYDIWRNIGIALVATIGLVALFFNNTKLNMNLLDWVLGSAIALILSILLLNLRELMELFS